MIPALRKGEAQSSLRRLIHVRELGLLFAILAVIGLILLLDTERNFISSYNRERLLHHFSLLGVFAIGEAVVIIAGGIDLSPGAVIGFTGVICALILQHFGESLPAGEPLSYGMIAGAIGLTLLIGLAIGLFHAFLITKLELPPFVATLGTLAGLRSAARILSDSSPISVSD
ncbi:MAG: ABC transporter permease, partial [Armatimonadetes bacterium]|nr:ABC transporter permease [Armatimonadota bacterium]